MLSQQNKTSSSKYHSRVQGRDLSRFVFGGRVGFHVRRYLLHASFDRLHKLSVYICAFARLSAVEAFRIRTVRPSARSNHTSAPQHTARSPLCICR